MQYVPLHSDCSCQWDFFCTGGNPDKKRDSLVILKFFSKSLRSYDTHWSHLCRELCRTVRTTFLCLHHLTSVATKVLLRDPLEGENIGFTGCLDLMSRALLGPLEGEITFDKFECFQRCTLPHSGRL